MAVKSYDIPDASPRQRHAPSLPPGTGQRAAAVIAAIIAALNRGSTMNASSGGQYRRVNLFCQGCGIETTFPYRHLGLDPGSTHTGAGRMDPGSSPG